MPRRVLIIGIGLAVVIVPAVILLFAVDRSPTLQNAVEQITSTEGPTTTVNQTPVETNTATEDPEQASITYVARNFSEIYGNESNQNEFKNLIDAQEWGTQSFNDFLNRSISQGVLVQDASVYQAISTKTIVITITNQTDTAASVTVGTQRQETIDQDTTVFYQDLFLDLVKQTDAWQINSAAWEPR